MTTHITIAAPVQWPTIVATLAAQGIAVQMRLIDGQLAFPHEQPGETWRELRVASNGKMVTLARKEQGIDLVCWGNADEESLKFRDALAAALTSAAADTNTRENHSGGRKSRAENV